MGAEVGELFVGSSLAEDVDSSLTEDADSSLTEVVGSSLTEEEDEKEPFTWMKDRFQATFKERKLTWASL